MARVNTVLLYPIQRLADYDDEREYEQVGMVRHVVRETPGAVLLRVVDWQQDAWFPRNLLWIDDEDVIWTDREFYRRKERERV